MQSLLIYPNIVLPSQRAMGVVRGMECRSDEIEDTGREDV